MIFLYWIESDKRSSTLNIVF